MSDSEGYNGWRNYPTWAVHLWLTNEQGLSEMTLEAVRDEINAAADCMAVKDGSWTIEQARRFNTADTIKEIVAELLPETSEAGMASDLLGWALAEVDWQEIADAFIETCEEIPA